MAKPKERRAPAHRWIKITGISQRCSRCGVNRQMIEEKPLWWWYFEDGRYHHGQLDRLPCDSAKGGRG